YLWTAPMNVTAPVVTHDPVSGEAMLRVALETKGEARDAAKAAVAEEGDRLAYVALTRAKEQIVVWAAPGARESHKSRLMCRLAQLAGLDALTTMSDLRGAVGLVQANAPDGAVALETFISGPSSSDASSATSPVPSDGLTVEVWGRDLGPPLRRWSFSALTADHDGSTIRTAQRPEDATGRGDTAADDEGGEPPLDAATATLPITGAAAADPPNGSPDPWVDLGAGTAFGSLVHEVLEEADLQAPDLEGEFARVIAAGSPPDELDQPRLAVAVAASTLTPMGGSLGSLTLAGLPRADQLRELDFDLPLEGASRPTGADLTRIVDHWLPSDDPLAGRTFALGTAATLPLAGMLTGSIDLTIRARGSAGEPDRYVVADYKTNLLAPWGTVDPEAAHPDRLVDAMVAHDYPLQALLYEVALHRYLRWRLPGYDPDVHLGGAAYLFLRGMAGPDTATTADGRTYGVFTWQPPTGLILALSNLLAGATLEEVTQ
ncbi:MAG: UvrD-helicase domain-containing protein, partial [Candidatus Neomicrothrix subdominans]